MSTTTLDPTVVGKLQRFGRRRFRMLVARGICAALVTFLLCIAFVALIDWYWVLTDQVRWILSGSAYLVTAIVVWATSVRKLLQTPAREELATHVEDAEPELRQNLLSAVELATDRPDTVHDSPVFRGLLQGKVATQMAKVEVPNLLPLRLLGKWLLAAFAIVVAVVALMSLPDPRFRTLAARAILPGANIDRVSRIRVEIFEPTPTSITIARDETVAVVVGVSGGAVSEVVLETFTPEGSQRQSMRSRTDSEFAANIHVGEDTIEYRILAGDAVTRRHTITAKGRPQVLAFRKTFVYPEYSGLPQKEVTDQTGDLIALEGTNAALQLELDQDVSLAELRIDSPESEDVRIVPLSRNDDGHWCADVPVEESAIYKVRLVSSETGFENVFAPRYEIRPLPDLIPRAGFVDQQETNLLLPPNDILALKGLAEDDLPLVSLQQEISVNGREWVAVPLEADRVTEEPRDVGAAAQTSEESAERHRLASSWNWDLLDMQLKTGDQITTRLVATDRKGNRGESVPLRIIVSAPEFDPERHVQIERKAAFYDRLKELETLTAEHKTTANEILKRLKDERGRPADQRRPEAEIALDRMNLADLADQLREAGGEALTEAQAITQAMPAGADAYDLELTGRMLARVHYDLGNSPKHLLAVLRQTTDEKEIRALHDKLGQAFELAANDTKSLAYHYQHLICHDMGSALATDMDAILRQQELVTNSPTQTWDRLLRQETVVLNQLRIIERLVASHERRLAGHMRSQFQQLRKWSSERIEQLERASESEDKLPELQQLAKNLLREFNDRQRIDVSDGGLSERLNQARRGFDYRSRTLSEPLTNAGTSIREENKRLSEAAVAEDSTKSEELRQDAARFGTELALKHRPSMDQLRARRKLVQARQDGDPQFAADAGLTHRAVTSLLNQHGQGDPQESIVPTAFYEIAPAYRILEAGYDLKNVQLSLSNLIQLERWSSQDLKAKIDHPRQWDVVHKGLEQAVNKLRAARVDNEIMGRLDQARWSQPAQEASRKLSQRRWNRDKLVGASADLIDFRDQLRPVSYEIEAVMMEARAVIAKYAPTIPQMAKEAAEQLRELEELTSDVADAVEENEAAEADQQPTEDASSPPPPTDEAPQLADLQEEQERINQQLDDLVEALIEDANAQDLMDEEQRERARDADDSIAMVQEPAKQMNEALQEAEEATNAEQQAQDLAEAAEQQERTAQALEQVAEHFDRLEQGLDVQESRDQLRQQEREMGLARQMDQRYEDAEELSEMAQQNPEELLQELEAELAQNPAMREALSQISENAVQEARNALEDAAKREREIQRANERSDKELQQKKRELANELKQLGNDAAQLSQQLVAQARSAASQAKSPEAQQKFEQTQQKLNEAANEARRANEGELQEELAAKAKAAQEAINEAAETLAEAKQQAGEAAKEEIHADDKTRNNAKKSLEDQRRRFQDQRKRTAEQAFRREESDERRAKANVQNAERNLKNFDRQVDQAEKSLRKKPDDRNAKNRVAQAEARKQQAQQKVDAAKAQQQAATRDKNEAREERNRINSLPQPPLNEKNPAAELAEAFAEEASQIAKDLTERAEELANAAKVAEAAVPEKGQLAWSAQQQERLRDGVEQTADNVARAARHERRLESAAAAEALQKASDNIEQVAQNEATEAQQQLQSAADAAQPPEQSGAANPAGAQQATAAREAVEASEQALTAQAEALSGVLEPMQAANNEAGSEAASASDAESGQQQSGDQQSARQQPDGSQSQTPSDQQPAQGSAESGSSEAGPPSSPASGSTPQESFSPEEMARGRQLAQTLDELDRQQAAASQAAESGPSSGQPDGQPPSQPAPKPLANLTQAARAQQAQIAAARTQAQQRAALSSEGRNPEGEPAYEGQSDPFEVIAVARDEEGEWGKLREQAAEDLTKGRREKVSEEYRKSVETYFRVLAERARRKK